LKSQLTTASFARLDQYLPETLLYKRIHGYDEQIPNGIVTIGQLLPDLSNNTPYNQSMGYISPNNGSSALPMYPQNSFLEELNKTANIEKMW
jgi:hypothetical protein